MLLPDDDEIYEVDQSYLGPPGRFLGVYRYKAIGIGLILIPMVFVTFRALGIHFGWFGTLLTLIACVASVMWLADRITYERPVVSLLGDVWSELVAPRESTKSVAVVATGIAARSRPDKAISRWQRKMRTRGSHDA